MSWEASNQTIRDDLFTNTSLLEDLVNWVDITTTKSIVWVSKVKRRIQRNGHLYWYLKVFYCEILYLDKRKWR